MVVTRSVATGTFQPSRGRAPLQADASRSHVQYSSGALSRGVARTTWLCIFSCRWARVLRCGAGSRRDGRGSDARQGHSFPTTPPPTTLSYKLPPPNLPSLRWSIPLGSTPPLASLVGNGVAPRQLRDTIISFSTVMTWPWHKISLAGAAHGCCPLDTRPNARAPGSHLLASTGMGSSVSCEPRTRSCVCAGGPPTAHCHRRAWPR